MSYLRNIHFWNHEKLVCGKYHNNLSVIKQKVYKFVSKVDNYINVWRVQLVDLRLLYFIHVVIEIRFGV